MSINRIDFQGSFAQTANIGQVKAAEDARPQADQNAFQVQFEKEKERESTSVKEADQSAKQESKFDAREKSKNEYQRLKKEKKKQDDEEEGGVIDMSGRPVGAPSTRSMFDLKV